MNFLFRHAIGIFFFFLLFFMVFRNPFSERTLISNLEPFPDSFHYIEPAFSFLEGKGFFFEREGRTFRPSVPPLYSLVLAPFFLLYRDVRMFYFANVVLLFASYLAYYFIIRRMFSSKIIWCIALFLFASSPFFSWFAQLAMAENLLLLLYLLTLLTFSLKISVRNSLFVALLTIALYATKYASLPLTCAIPVLYGMRILFSSPSIRKKISISFLSFLCIFGLLYCLYEWKEKGNNIPYGLFRLAQSVLFPAPSTPKTGGGAETVFFSLQFAKTNIAAYSNWLLGSKIQILWKSMSIVPFFLALIAWVGTFYGVFKKQTRFFFLSIIGMQMSVIAFLSVFYAYDGRYFFIAIPSMYIGFAMACQILFDMVKGKIRRVVPVVLFLVLCSLFFWKASEIKYTLALNLKYAETPWYYISIRQLDSFLQNRSTLSQKPPVVIASIPAFLIDAYSDTTKIILPLNKGQEFRSRMGEVYGTFDFNNLEAEYRRLLREGNDVFLFEYGLGNEAYLHQDFDRLLSSFDATKVQQGCFDLCDIYQLREKHATRTK